MALTPSERKAAEKRIVDIGERMDAIDAKLEASPLSIESDAVLERAKLFKERALLLKALLDDDE